MTSLYESPREDPPPFVPPRDQMGLFAAEYLPASHQPNKAETLSLPIEIAEVERKVKQGSFESHKLGYLNAVVQQRKIYDDIDVLADNIEEEELLIHPLLVARYTTPEAAHKYLMAAYGTVGKKVPFEHRKRLADLVSAEHDGQQVWYIVIAGHRRLRALEMLGEVDSMVQVIDDIDPFKALKLQVSENTSKLPKEFERAEQNGDLWTVDKAIDPNLTREEFAKRVGHRPEVIRRDLLYYSLPEEIKNMVVPRNTHDTGRGNTVVTEQPLMPYRVASQLGRLVERDVEMHDVLFMARRFWDENITSEKAAGDRVSAFLREHDKGNVDMLNLFAMNAEESVRLRRHREVAARFAHPIDSAIAYLSRVSQAREHGLTTDQDGISFAGAGTRMKKLADVMDGLLPAMRDELTSAKRAEIRNTLVKWERLASRFEALGKVSEEDLDEVRLVEGESQDI